MILDSIIYPEEIILEVTNLCNLRCRFCHFHGEGAKKKRELGFMPPQIWEKILDEIEKWDKPCTILTHGAGEPLLYPHLESLLIKAKQNPKVRVGFMTNGMLLTPDVSKMLISLKIDSLALSIDGIIPDTHDNFRKNADLKLIERNLKYLIDEKARSNSSLPALTFNMVGYPEILEQETGYVEKWLLNADAVMVSKFRPVGSRKLWDINNSSLLYNFTPCHLLYNQVVISICGDIGLCCEDINVDLSVGNLLDSDLLTIYNNSPVLSSYRKFHENGDISELKLCSDCHIWGASIKLESYEKRIGSMRVSCEVYQSGKVYRKI